MVNIHSHVFLEKDVPRNFLPLGLVGILKTKVGFFLLSKVLTRLNVFNSGEQLERYSNFIRSSMGKSQKDLFNDLAANYPKDTKIVVLPMDMAFMGAGKVPRPYTEQLDELVELRKENSNVIPFIHVDPRRTGYMGIVKEYHAKFGITGIKLYPPLGIFPFDYRLQSVYKYCVEKKLPILAHCTPGNPVHFMGSKSELRALLSSSKLTVDWKLSRKDLCAYFTHPVNYRCIMDRYPTLKICLAHFGRENEWDKIIRTMMPDYPGLYADISYSLYDEEHWGYLKVLLETDMVFRNKCLFGSDWYMNTIEGEEKQFSINLRAYLGETLWNQIAVTNPNKFLGLE